ncbi:MAG: cell wall-binding repeat-containing protein, partial [Firmicutes bacterium]|nr:cell wall-binding repeat-containing protein [Bacillota bacterium]
EQLGVEKFDAIVVATGMNYADALSGAYLGSSKKAPILLVNSGVLNDVKDYIRKNLKDGGTVYLLGGETIVPAAVTEGITGVTTKRLYGPNRYDTNLEILKELGINTEDLLVCDGRNFADSLSASAVTKPILLVKETLNDDQRAYLGTLDTGHFYLIGGTGAVPEAVETELKSKYGEVTRVGGANRYETSALVAEAFFPDTKKAVVAFGQNYPDGLCGGPLGAYIGAPILLSRDASVSITAKYSNKAGITSGVVLGGPALISDDSVRKIFSMKAGDEIKVIN